MIVSIMAKGDGKQGGVWLESAHPAFKDKYGDIRVDTSYLNLFRTMEAIAIWANNDVDEECLFEVI